MSTCTVNPFDVVASSALPAASSTDRSGGPAPASVDLWQKPVSYGIVPGTVRWIMHNGNLHTRLIGRIHKILPDNVMPAGIRAAAVTQNSKTYTSFCTSKFR